MNFERQTIMCCFLRGLDEAEIQRSGNLRWKNRKRKRNIDGHPRA